MGLFEDAEQKFQDSLAIQRDNARALHGFARSLAARNKLNDALTTAQAALNRDPRDAEFHHTVGSIYEQMRRYEEAANAYSSYINLLPNKDRSAKAAWARAEVRFLRAFGTRVPLNIVDGSAGKLHTIPFRVLNEKIIVKARVNRGPQMDFVLDTGSEQTVISRETAARMGIRPIVNILSAGVGDLGVRELELTRLDELEVGGSLKVQNVPSIIKNPPLQGLPTREMESFSPLALGMSVIIDYDRQQLIMGNRVAGRNGGRRAAIADAPARDGAGPRAGWSGKLHSRHRGAGHLDQHRYGKRSRARRDEEHSAQGVRRVGMGSRRFPHAWRQPELHEQDRVQESIGCRVESARAERAARLQAGWNCRLQVPEPLPRRNQSRQEHRAAAGAAQSIQTGD